MVIHHIIAYIHHAKPMIFILENVKGFVALNNGRDMRKMVDRLRKLSESSTVSALGESDLSDHQGGVRKGVA